MACSEKKNWQKIELENMRGEKISFQEKSGPLVFYFLSPQCPLCENYALNIRNHYEDMEMKGITFYGVFPGNYYKREEILSYKKRYNLDIDFLLDPTYVFTHALDAKVTPEVFVFNSNKQLLYQGAIDNWMVTLGKKRTLVSEHYLSDALNAMLQNSNPKIEKTQAIGCYIE